MKFLITDNFASSVTGEEYKINHRFNCYSKCLMYLLSCKKSSKQCTGEAVDNFRLRWNNYKSNDWKFQRGESFDSKGHEGFLKDVLITLTDKTDASDPKRRENYWMRTLKTLAPVGFNVEDSV